MFNGQMSTVRVVVSVAIILGCFTVIYPRFFHPIVMKILGVQPKKTDHVRHSHPPHRPHGANMATPPPQHPNTHDDVRRHMRPGPHPGMRAAAEMNQKQGGGGRGGIMGVVLPMYAVGIVVYLVYTLFKVFNKQGKGDLRRQREREKEERLGKKYMSSPVSDVDPSNYPEVQESATEQLNDIEEILNRADDKNISDKQMLELQKRLQETEAQMAKILKAMQTVSSHVQDVADETVPGSDDGKAKEETRSSDSSPDLSTYEVVKKNRTEAQATDILPEVETIKAGEVSNCGQEEENDNSVKDTEEDKDEENESDKEDENEEKEVLLDSKTEGSEDENNVRKRKVHSKADSAD